MHDKHKEDPNSPISFVLVDKLSLRLRIDKTYYTLDEAAIKYGISAENIAAERARYQENRERNSRKRAANVQHEEAPGNKQAKVN
ncbi:hypothetical protein ANCCAN_24609 [Ancylostoma caninum]|uniref:Uncharacterized protein n=1 Tax=Ancylostoma caninum TaxID=29170 RepID=A0A368FC37_ANCCA|nr:hypothetical protein ANCCAN_24609 [Ancylostoma caninum]